MRILFCFLFFCISFVCFGQLAADPNDALYDHITIWEDKGYTGHLPLLRPYPHSLLKKILESVIGKGTPVEQRTARSFYEQLFFSAEKPRPDHIVPSPFSVTINNSLWAEAGTLSYLYGLRPTVTFQDMVTDWFSVSGMAVMGVDIAGGDPSPCYMRTIDDGKSGGGYVDLGSIIANGSNNGIGMVFFGKDDLYIQAGINRSGFGPFWDDSGIIGSHAPAAGHISYTWQAGWATFTSVLLILNPKYFEGNTAITGSTIGAKFPISDKEKPTEKYLVIHSYSFHITEWWTATLVQSVLFSKRFQPAYLIPLQHLMYTQLLLGDVDSSFIGLTMEFDLPLDANFDFLLYLDDFNLSKFLGNEGQLFDINSGQNKFAIQAGLSWTPQLDILQKISLSYFMITPYTYTHDGSLNSRAPYNSYTHEGFGIGTILSPNSDRIALNAFLQPWSFCDIKLFALFTRHGNASDGNPLIEATSDGTYWDDGRDEDSIVGFYGHSRFLTQATLEKILQIGFSADFRIGLGFGRLLFGLGYIFEYGWDRDCTPGDNSARHIFNVHAGIEL